MRGQTDPSGGSGKRHRRFHRPLLLAPVSAYSALFHTSLSIAVLTNELIDAFGDSMKVINGRPTTEAREKIYIAHDCSVDGTMLDKRLNGDNVGPRGCGSAQVLAIKKK